MLVDRIEGKFHMTFQRKKIYIDGSRRVFYAAGYTKKRNVTFAQTAFELVARLV